MVEIRKVKEGRKEGYACHSIMRFPIFMFHTSVMLVTKKTSFTRDSQDQEEGAVTNVEL